MAKQATGELRPLADGWEARIRIDDEGNRRGFELVGMPAADKVAARERCTAMAAIALRLRKAGHVTDIPEVMKMAARARAGRSWEAVVAGVDLLCGGKTSLDGRPALPTFLDHLKDWTSGALAKKYPDHVKVKRSVDGDRCRIDKHIAPHLEGIRADQVTLSHCEIVMASIPETRSAGTRRQVAQLLRRGLALAVYPCRYRTDNPIPKGWLPNAKTNKAKECLYPDEDAKLLACTRVPLLRRLAYGFLAREGMRTDELARLEWRDVDLERGRVDLDTNKTDEPRSWALDDGVLAALRIWKERFCKEPEDGDRVFQEGGVPLNVASLAKRLRADLKEAGVKREKLFERSDRRLPIRAHDLRATFVTIALASGKTETWVADRTGHKSSQMINRYRRKARTWADQKLGSLLALHKALPELIAPCNAPYFVGQPGLEPETNGLRGQSEASQSTDPEKMRSAIDPVQSQAIPHGAVVGHSLGRIEDVEQALAKALEGATAAARWDLVGQIARELAARRLAREPNVVPLTRTKAAR